MNRDIVLHHIISAIVIVMYFVGLQSLMVNLVSSFDAFVLQSDLHRVWIIGLLVLLYFVIPTTIYSLLKHKLLPMLKVKQPKLKPFIIQNLKLVGAYVVAYIIWNVIGGGLKDPTTNATSIIMLLYGLLLLLFIGQWVLFVQLTHKHKTFKKAKKAWDKKWKYGLAWTVGWLVYITVAYYAISFLSAQTQMVQYILFIALAIGAIIIYTKWQEEVYK